MFFEGAHNASDPQGKTIMKHFAFLTGFLLLTTAVAIPLFLMKKGMALRRADDDNIRYDIDDYMAAEGL